MFSLPSPRRSRAATLVPYVACVVLLIALLPLGRHPHKGELVLALAIQVLIGLGLLAGRRLGGRPWLPAAGIVAYLVSVAMLRDAGGSMSGYGALALLPVLWTASTGRRREMVLAVAGTALVFAVPILAIGPPRYPAVGWRSGGLATVIAASLGTAVLGLVHSLRRRTHDLESILGAMSEGLAITRDGEIVAVNPALCAMTGFTEDQLVGARPPYPFWPPELHEQTEQLRRDVVAAGGAEFQLTLIRADGRRFPGAVTASSTELGDGSRAFINTLRDVTAQQRHVHQLTALGAVARAVGHSDPLDARHTICRVALQVCGGAHLATIWEPAEDGGLVSTSMEPSIGETFRIGADPQHGAQIALREARALFVGDAATSVHCDRRLVEQLGAGSVHFQPIADADGVRGVLGISFPKPLPALTEDLRPLIEVLADEAAVAMQRADLLARLDELTRTDELTGLPNRRAWDELLGRELHAAERHGDAVSVAMLDLDHFKAYNDHHGHLAGDRLLQVAAERWQERLRISDVLARWGGEEFALLLPGCDAACAVAMLERLRGTLPDGVTFSAGVAQWDGRAAPRTLIDEADQALYLAKAGGRDRTATLDELPVRQP